MPEPDEASRNLSDLFGNLPTAASPSTGRQNREAREAPAPGSRRALREAAAREAAARESDTTPAHVTPPASTPIAPPAPAVPARSAARADDSFGSADVASEPAHAAPDRTEAPGAAPVEAHPSEADPSQADPNQADPEAASLHSLFAPEQHHDVPKKRRGRGCLIGLIIMLVVFGGIAAGGAWVWSQYGDRISDAMGWGEPKDYEPGIATGEVLVTIKSDDTGSQVSTALFEAGVTKTDRVFYDYLVAEKPSATFYPGVYTMQEKMTAAAALESLDDPANRMENTVRIGEGGTVASSLPQIVDGVGIPMEELQAAIQDPTVYGVQAETLEGWLFPAVYTFDPGATAQDVIGRMVARTQESLDEIGVSADDAQRVLTVASIVQREGHTADFDKVSRVIANRLDPANDETHGLLQMDSTAQYGYGLTHEGPVASWPWESVKNDQNPWNTYQHAGLPASPIANPSHAAIAAAQNPADGPWFYFVTVNLDTGETVFSATYAEQQAAEAQYRKWCEENPDGGCY
ncbi:endolytic transglycosylase MltG [Microbacterium alcoholitolerans]|uniref:endolytic transglycosylase MltG n=1 Tax=unclassified Microbacterium TaxID=2609290 RepID=UPI003D17ADC2